MKVCRMMEHKWVIIRGLYPWQRVFWECQLCPVVFWGSPAIPGNKPIGRRLNDG